MAFDRLYSNIIFFSSLPFASAADTARAQFDGLTSSLVFVALAFALAFLPLKGDAARLVNSRVVLSLSCVMTIAGSLAMAPGIAEHVPAFIGSGLIGFGSSMLLISWLGVFARETVTSSLTEIGIAFSLSFAASFVFSLVGGSLFFIALLVCPLASFASLILLRHVSIQKNESLARPISKEGRRLERRNIIYVFFCGCIIGMMRNYSAAHVFGEQMMILDILLSLSGLIVCLVVVVMARLTDVSAARFLYRISFVFILMSSIVLAFESKNIIIATALTFVGMQCFICCLIARAMLASWALGGSSWRKCISTFGILYLGEFAGIASALFLVGRTNVMVCSLVLSCCVLIGYVFFFTEADYLLISKKLKPAPSQESDTLTANRIAAETPSSPSTSAQNESNFEASEEPNGAGALPNTHMLPDETSEIALDEICDRISAEFGLTPRESEILPSVARGRTIARIQKELFISSSTVNTHIRHIYAKCGVANRQELLDFVDDRRRPQANDQATSNL